MQKFTSFLFTRADFLLVKWQESVSGYRAGEENAESEQELKEKNT